MLSCQKGNRNFIILLPTFRKSYRCFRTPMRNCKKKKKKQNKTELCKKNPVGFQKCTLTPLNNKALRVLCVLGGNVINACPSHCRQAAWTCQTPCRLHLRRRNRHLRSIMFRALSAFRGSLGGKYEWETVPAYEGLESRGKNGYLRRYSQEKALHCYDVAVSVRKVGWKKK